MEHISQTHNKQLYELLFLINKSIVNDISTSELTNLFSSFLRNNIQIKKAYLQSNHEEESFIFLYGFNEADIAKVIFPEHFHSDDFKWIERGLENKKIQIPLYYGSRILASLYLEEIPDPFINEHNLTFLQTIASLMMTAIENKKWYKEFKQKTELNKEIELAKNVQQLLIPKVLPNNNLIQTSAYFLPHQHLSGDYYDFVQTGEDEIAFCMADVTGKGIPAAILMSNFQANWRTLMNYFPNLSQLVSELNRKVYSASLGEKFITCFIGKYNFNTRILSYVNAGHTAPVLFGGDNPLLLKVGCTGLGMFADINAVKQGYLIIPNDSFLLCYTDGLIELEDNDGEQFGSSRLIEFIREIKSNHPEKINNLILEKLKQFRGENKFNDDVALLSFKFL